MSASPRRRNLIATVVVALVLLLLIFSPRKCGGPPKPKDLLEALLRLRTQVEWPGLDVAAAARELGTKEKAFAFVRDDIAYLGYRGAWGGSAGTPRTRVGNTTDKAMLLAALLEKQGLKTRLVRAPFPSGEKIHPAEGKMPDFPALADVRAFIGAHQGSDASPADPSGAIRAEGEAAAKRLEEVLAAAGEHPDMEWAPKSGDIQATEAPEADWVWVQAKAPDAPENAWETLDPVMPGRARPEKFDVAWNPAPATLAIDVESADERGRARPLAQWQGAAADALGHEISVAFLPALCPERLGTLTDPAQVGLWATVLQVGPQMARRGAFGAGGVVVTERDGKMMVGDSVLIGKDDAGHPRPPVPIDTLSVTDVDGSRWPRVRLQLTVTSKSRPTWHSAHLRVSDAGGKPCRTRLESSQTDPRPLLIVLDVSSSMSEGDNGGRIRLAKEALRRLIERLDPAQEVGLMTFGYSAGMIAPIGPLGPQKEKLLETIAGTDAIGIGTKLYDAVEAAGKACQRPSAVVCLTDGGDTGGKGVAYGREKAAELRAAGHVLIPVGIGEADPIAMREMARGAETSYLEVKKIEDLGALFGAIGNDLAGGLGMSFEAPPGAKPGDKVTFTLNVAGYPDPVRVDVTVPAAAGVPSGSSRIQLRVTVTSDIFGDQPRTYVRNLQDLRPGFDAWELVAFRRLGFSIAPPPARVQFAREIDELIEMVRGRKWAAGGPAPTEFAAKRGASLRTCRVQRDLFFGAASSAPANLPLGWTGPGFFLETFQVRGEAGEPAALRRTLDIMASTLGPENPAKRSDRARFGLALAPLEAAILHAPSANRPLLDAPALTTTRTPDGLDDFFTPGRDIALLHPGVPAAWVFPPSGDARTVLGARAKGASVEETAAEFKRIRLILQMLGALANGALSETGSPNGALFAALCSFWDEQMKLWCYSSVMLGLVSEGIEEGKFDAQAASARAKELCEIEGDLNNWGRNAMDALGTGFAKGWIGGTATRFGSDFFKSASDSKFSAGFGSNWSDAIPDAGRDLTRDTWKSKAMP
jgi:hypothetical protein